MIQVLVNYFSKFGNTQALADRISESVDSALRPLAAVRTMSSNDLSGSDLKGLDLVIIGTPTHKMNLPNSVRPVLEKLPANSLKGVPFAAFDTSYKMS